MRAFEFPHSCGLLWVSTVYSFLIVNHFNLNSFLAPLQSMCISISFSNRNAKNPEAPGTVSGHGQGRWSSEKEQVLNCRSLPYRKLQAGKALLFHPVKQFPVSFREKGAQSPNPVLPV